MMIYHLAAQTSSKLSNESPEEDTKLNFLPVVNIIALCQKNSWKRDIIFSGSVTEAGLTPKKSVDEKYPDRPITIYDIHKYASEKYLRYFACQKYGRSVTLRLANVYGPGRESGSADRGILNRMILYALQDKPITLFGGGNYIRDYIYIDDVADAFIQAGRNIARCNGKNFIISTNHGYTLKEAVLIIKEILQSHMHKSLHIHNQPFPENLSPIEKRNFVGNNSHFCKITHWHPRYTLYQGINATINYFIPRFYKEA